MSLWDAGLFFLGGGGWAGVSAGEGELVTGSQNVLGAGLGALTQAVPLTCTCEATEALRVCIRGASLGGSDGKESACNQVTRVQSLGREGPLGKGMATPAGIPAWRIPRTGKPGRRQSIRSQRVRHD